MTAFSACVVDEFDVLGLRDTWSCGWSAKQCRHCSSVGGGEQCNQKFASLDIGFCCVNVDSG